jgi:hypothetical protein
MKATVLKVSAAALGLLMSVPTLAAEVDRRAERQQERIAEGVENGSLMPRETVNLERREAKINREIKRDRAANGGTLTPAERAKINREQNRASRAIYRKKHNDVHR